MSQARADERAIDALPPLRDVIARHGLNARKELGQNFLLDLNLTGTHRPRRRRPLASVTVIEVGPGPGGLTRALLSAGGAERSSPSSATTRALPALAEIADA